jgi:hypothetical protein
MEHPGDPAYVDMCEHWEAALVHASHALDHLRAIYPSRISMIPETGNDNLFRAIDAEQSCIVNITRAGRHVLGVEQFDSFMDEYNDPAARLERGVI